MEPAPSAKLSSGVDESIRRVWKAMYPICTFHNVDFRQLVDKHEPTHREPLLEFSGMLLGDVQYSIRSGLEDVISHYGVAPLERIADAAALSKGVRRLAVTAMCFVLRYSSISSTRCCQQQDRRGVATVTVVMPLQLRRARGRKSQFSRSRVFGCTTVEKWRTI